MGNEVKNNFKKQTPRDKQIGTKDSQKVAT